MHITTINRMQKQSQCRSASTLLSILAAAALFGVQAYGFTLLGPHADWMMQTNGYRQPGDIGGPMDIDEGYRWNVPVVTYGFDQAFLDYFGPNGVAAVERSIKVL